MNRNAVYRDYEEIAEWFDSHRSKELMEKSYLDLIIGQIPKGGSILDLGCGTGEPIAQYFIQNGFKITGVDGSAKMIERCKTRFPNEEWIVADMRDINLDRRFDAIVAWHSFFHLDHESQRLMFKRFDQHIKPDGLLAFTSGTEYGEVWGNNGGKDLYHASLSTEEYLRHLTEFSFKVLIHKIRDPDCGEATVWVSKKV